MLTLLPQRAIKRSYGYEKEMGCRDSSWNFNRRYGRCRREFGEFGSSKIRAGSIRIGKPPEAEFPSIAKKRKMDRQVCIRSLNGEDKHFMGFGIRTVAARHISIIRKSEQFMSGVPFGDVISTPDDINIYHAGDTGIFGDIKIIKELYNPRIMLIGDHKISDPYPIKLSPYETALATQWIGPYVL